MRKELKLNINKEEYYLITDYKDDNHYRQSLNRLTLQNFGFDFEQWYQMGYWSDKYRPYSLLHKDEVIANISVNPIDFLIDGRLRRSVQLGTVMTDKNYRHIGLSRTLMEIVLNEYEKESECIYLYANDSVLEFYPKFGFVEAGEYNYSKHFHEQEGKLTVRKLQPQEEKDKTIIIRLLNNSVPISRYAMVGNPGLIMFYLTSLYAENIYYIEEMDLAAVTVYKDGELQMMDIFCEHEFDLDQVINSLMNQSEMKVILGFTPLNNSAFTAEPLKEEDITFFIKGKSLIDKGRFPILSHA